MNFIKLFIWFIGVMSFFELNAQQTGKVTMFSENESTEMDFRRYTNLADNTTKYIILKNTVEFFEIVFKYDGDSILIYWIDREKIRIDSNLLKFNLGDKRILISDYQVNVPTIVESPTTLILFSTEKESQFITLYQFKPFTGSRFYFKFLSIPDNVREDHRLAMVEYNNQQQTKKERAAVIDTLKKDMWDYKDAIISKCRQKEANEVKTSKANANDDLNAVFFPGMNSIFKNAFQNLILFGGIDSFNVRFEFVCNERGMITVDTTTKGIYFTDGQVRSWFRDSFIVYAKPAIQALIIRTTTKTLKNPDLITDFEKEFNQRVEEVDPDRRENLFAVIIKEIKDSLQLFSEYNILVPTRYFYEITVKSETKFPVWKYSGIGEILTKSEDFKQEDITEDLKQQFMALNLKTGFKYTIEHCTISINDQKFKPHIREANKMPF